jgi:hypothetical protein
MRALAPGNLAAAAAVVIAGAIGGEVQEIVWTVVVLMLWFATKAGWASRSVPTISSSATACRS